MPLRETENREEEAGCPTRHMHAGQMSIDLAVLAAMLAVVSAEPLDVISTRNALGSPDSRCAFKNTFVQTKQNLAFLAAVAGFGGTTEREEAEVIEQNDNGCARNSADHTTTCHGRKKVNRRGLCVAVCVDHLGVESPCQRTASFAYPPSASRENNDKEKIRPRVLYCKRHRPAGCMLTPRAPQKFAAAAPVRTTCACSSRHNNGLLMACNFITVDGEEKSGHTCCQSILVSIALF